MIGMTTAWTAPVVKNTPIGGGPLSLPLPFFFGEDSGIGLPIAALPFNDVRIVYEFRDWKELIMVNANGGAATIDDVCVFINGVAQTSTQPSLSNVETFAHYAIVHNDERVKMGDAPRDILIHQVQNTNTQPFKDMTSQSTFDLRLSHSIVSFCFMAQNITLQSSYSGSLGYEQSNYTTLSAWSTTLAQPSFDPISFTQLSYENSVRLALFSDYFSLTHPWYFSDAIAENTGYHIWSYALKPWDPTRPSGSTNFSKLANVSITHTPSPAAVSAAAGLYADGVTNIPGLKALDAAGPWKQVFQHVFLARNHNILRIANGSAGFPSL